MQKLNYYCKLAVQFEDGANEEISTFSRDNFLTTPTAAISAKYPNYIPFELIEYCSVTRPLSSVANG